MPPTQAFSHLTAAQLYGFPLPNRLEAVRELHVAVQPPAHPPQMQGVVGHRLFTPMAFRDHRGFRVVPPSIAWIELAPLLTHGQLVEVGDFLVRRKYALATIDQLADAAASVAGVRGIAAIRRALADVRHGTDSPRETRLRLTLVASGLPEPVVHFQVIDADGYFVASPDLAYPEFRVALEYQGGIHQTDRGLYVDDIDRIERLEAAGWKVISVVSEHLIRRPDLLVDRVARALVERGAALGPLRRP